MSHKRRAYNSSDTYICIPRLYIQIIYVNLNANFIADHDDDAQHPNRLRNDYRTLLPQYNSFTSPVKERLLTFNSLKAKSPSLQLTFARFVLSLKGIFCERLKLAELLVLYDNTFFELAFFSVHHNLNLEAVDHVQIQQSKSSLTR